MTWTPCDYLLHVRRFIHTSCIWFPKANHLKLYKRSSSIMEFNFFCHTGVIPLDFLKIPISKVSVKKNIQEDFKTICCFKNVGIQGTPQC